MRSSYVATLGVASLFALGCADSSSDAPTDPGLEVRANHLATAACVSADSRTAQAQLKAMLAGATLKTAQALWSTVEANCSTTAHDNANNALMAYVAHVRSQYPAGFIAPKAPATKESNFLGHLNTVFSYVGYAAPNIPSGATGPLQAGILGVIPSTGGQREYQREHLGAFKLDGQFVSGDQRGHLFIMYPLSGDCLSVANLAETGDCVQLSAFPGISAGGFDPEIKVGVCAEGVQGVQGGHVLGHETGNGTEVAGEFAYPADCHASLPGSVAAIGTPLQNMMNRFASFGRKTFGIRNAYATDRGLGGIGSTLSAWGGLNALVFAAEFNVPPNTLNQQPVDVGNYDFDILVTNPSGSVLVKSSLGNYTGPLAVLSQGGGNCTNCGGLWLTAKFFSNSAGAVANAGTYDVTWKSLQAAPAVKGAPFYIRDSQGRVVAKLTYSSVQSTNYLTYNSTVLADSLGWVRNTAQSFRIGVNLNTNRTSLWINGALVLADQLFFDPDADDIASFSAEFVNIDSGVMGLDQIGVQRRSDQPSP